MVPCSCEKVGGRHAGVVVLQFGTDATAADRHRLARAEVDAGHAVRAAAAVPDARAAAGDLDVRARADLRAKAAAVAAARVGLLAERPRDERGARPRGGKRGGERPADFAQVAAAGLDVARDGVDPGFRRRATARVK